MIGNPLLGQAFSLNNKVTATCGDEIRLVMIGSEKDCYEFCKENNWQLNSDDKEWNLKLI